MKPTSKEVGPKNATQGALVKSLNFFARESKSPSFSAITITASATFEKTGEKNTFTPNYLKIFPYLSASFLFSANKNTLRLSIPLLTSTLSFF